MTKPCSLRRLAATFALAVVLPATAAPADPTDPPTETVTFAMYCYWTGEATVGRLDGVVASRIGHWGGREIVQVDYDPERTSLSELAGALRDQRSLDAVIVGTARKRADIGRLLLDVEVATLSGDPRFIEPKHSLRTRHPELWDLDLTEAQRIRLNSWSYFGGPMPDVLTAEQTAAFLARRSTD